MVFLKAEVAFYRIDLMQVSGKVVSDTLKVQLIDCIKNLAFSHENFQFCTASNSYLLRPTNFISSIFFAGRGGQSCLKPAIKWN